jgi:hypothetical protein
MIAALHRLFWTHYSSHRGTRGILLYSASEPAQTVLSAPFRKLIAAVAERKAPQSKTTGQGSRGTTAKLMQSAARKKGPRRRLIYRGHLCPTLT